jgi:hypothetical protein
VPHVLCSLFAICGLGSVPFGLICRQHFVARSQAPILGSPPRKIDRSIRHFTPIRLFGSGQCRGFKQLVVGVVPGYRLPPPPAFDRCAQGSFAILGSASRAFSWLVPHTLRFRQKLPFLCFHCSSCPFPNGPHQGGVISRYSKVRSPTCGYPFN